VSNQSTTPLLITKIGFLFGWLCFALAFIAAAAETALGDGFITSANDLLVAAMPGKWIAFKLRHASFLFDTFVLPVFHLPGWLIAGIPAGLLLWTCRPHREAIDPELLDSLTTYDRLAELAEEEGALDDDPTFTDFRMEDYDDEHSQEPVSSDTTPQNNSNRQLNEPDPLTEPVRPKGPHERMDDARENLSIPFDKLS
jgi:hypothetical protein